MLPWLQIHIRAKGPHLVSNNSSFFPLFFLIINFWPVRPLTLLLACSVLQGSCPPWCLSCKTLQKQKTDGSNSTFSSISLSDGAKGLSTFCRQKCLFVVAVYGQWAFCQLHLTFWTPPMSHFWRRTLNMLSWKTPSRGYQIFFTNIHIDKLRCLPSVMVATK